MHWSHKKCSVYWLFSKAFLSHLQWIEQSKWKSFESYAYNATFSVCLPCFDEIEGVQKINPINYWWSGFCIENAMVGLDLTILMQIMHRNHRQQNLQVHLLLGFVEWVIKNQMVRILRKSVINDARNIYGIQTKTNT